MKSCKFIVTGTPGAGKTSVITAICGVPPATIEMFVLHALNDLHTTPNIPIDFGQLELDDGEHVHFYGTRGQERRYAMRSILEEGSVGLIMLIDSSRPDPLADLCAGLDQNQDFIRRTGAVIGITHGDLGKGPGFGDYIDVLDRYGLVMPVLELDARDRGEVLMLLDMLMAGLTPPGLRLARDRSGNAAVCSA